MNSVTLMGRLGQDPETKSVNDTSVTNFSIATSKRWTDKSGHKQEKVNWHKCQAWGKTGEIIAQYHKKGDGILINGEIETRSYQKDDETRYVTEVKVTQFYFVPGSKAESAKGREAGLAGQTPKRPDVPNMAPKSDDLMGDFPF